MVESAFLKCLDVTIAQGRDVSHKPSRNWAPAVFEGMPQAGGISRHPFAGAMEHLLAAGRIRIEPFGPPSRGVTRLRRALPAAPSTT
jgi:hypothetical protein